MEKKKKKKPQIKTLPHPCKWVFGVSTVTGDLTCGERASGISADWQTARLDTSRIPSEAVIGREGENKSLRSRLFELPVL